MEMKKMTLILAVMLGLSLTVSACSPNDNKIDDPETERPESGLTGKILVVYYSFTNNSHLIATELQKQTDADIIRVEPAEENVDYNDYSIGLPMMNLIKAHPDNPASYPAIKTSIDNLVDYDTILIVAPLWWNNMAAPLQTFLFKYGAEMDGKSVGLVVSSGESGIAGVEADMKRLVPKAKYLEPSLWILRSHTDRCHDMITEWLKEIH